MDAYMRSVKVTSMDYGRIYAFANLFDLPRIVHNHQCIRIHVYSLATVNKKNK